ncbi:hypothetical protein FNV43_RR11020 [Rhamnella rubrinervis]|uniref:Uncharacterized protein n=1 Tax=Rhamnella rubrinervis TaxID=2594499 RepID=A0A8K0H5I5_9ROSA|nr:hypothetical protein FNV43_RR11020 [Rhamnella rubrinervis]
MAFDPPADHHHRLLGSLPVIDVRLLSQSELYCLSLCSSSSTSHPNRRCDDDVLIPKIDRSVFNESAGSRKQTYSRLRLAPRNTQFASTRAASITRQNPEPLDQENVQVVRLLKQLFASEIHDDLIPVPVSIGVENNDSVRESSCNFMQSIPGGLVVDNAQKKRKRGRPRKDANLAIENYTEKNYDNGILKREGPVLPVSSNMVLCNSQDNIVGGGIQTKRKRGRPLKNEKRAAETIKGGDKANATCEESREVLVHVNRNGGVVDLVALGNKSTPSIVDQSAVVVNVNKSSIGTINGTKVVDAEISKDSKLSIAFNSGIDADTISHMEQEVSSKGCSLVSSSSTANEHIYVLKTNVICNSKMEELKQNIDSSENDLPSCSGYARSYYGNMNVNSPSLIEEPINKEVKSSWNNEELHAFGSCNTGIDANPVISIQTGRRSEGFSPAILGTEQSISIANAVPGVCIGTVEELNLTRVSEIDLVCASGSEKIDAIENNFCSVNSSRLWEQPKSKDLDKSRNDEQMIDLRNHSQSSGDVAAELIWRTNEQNVQRSRLVDTSSALMQLSGCSPNFDISSDKDAYGSLGNNERYDSISGFEGLRLGSIRPSEYHALTSQGASDSNEPKVMLYDAEVGQGFDSSIWLEREVSSLFPKTGSRHQTVAICAWCRNEFQHDYVNPETHSDSGSVGLMCGTCQAKFSNEFNPL